MIGVVQKLETTGKGSKKLQISGVWYFAGRVDVDAVKVGDKIEFTFAEFGEDRGKGRLKGLEKWRPVVDASGTPETGSTVSEADILRSVSNVVGNACAAGCVKEPEQLAKWFVAAYQGFAQMGKPEKALKPEREAGSDDEHEFDDSAELEQMAAQAQSRERTRVW